ncbi:N-(5'-phosphoribosyl)anthranilate isomerase [Aliisedimentitalea sp. MJ-SS2]|uniref:N-(5'-phosphoribosyl)anthranilate isomerase n=1 Tax=Aliisedimentitalea sp. MJ-SS2 TaxID=3049795 RepID=UPI00292DC7A4|nr:N-(5'-phosphoribosyl)anthranilate isomerase [Alisedimentitalea sp. MJ-SS2]
MVQIPDHLTSETWIKQVFSSAEARKGGVVKRQVRDVERLAGRDAFLREIERRGFQAVQNGRHFVVFCNDLPLRRVRA